MALLIVRVDKKKWPTLRTRAVCLFSFDQVLGVLCLLYTKGALMRVIVYFLHLKRQQGFFFPTLMKQVLVAKCNSSFWDIYPIYVYISTFSFYRHVMCEVPLLELCLYFLKCRLVSVLLTNVCVGFWIFFSYFSLERVILSKLAICQNRETHH